MITTAPAKSHKEKGDIIEVLLENFYENQLIIGDIHAPMDQISDIFKIVDNGVIIGGWTIFHGFKEPTIIFPPGLKGSWEAIKTLVTGLGIKKFNLPFPQKVIGKNNQKPWDEWSDYKFTMANTDLAMRLGGKDIEVMDISHLPKIRGATEEDSEALTRFYANAQSQGDWAGVWHPLQLKSDLYVISENDHDEIIAAAGTHFETPYSVQMGNVYVDKAWRGIGLGKAITTAVLLGIARFKLVPTLFVHEKNEQAIEMYRKIGFEEYNKFDFMVAEKIES